MPRSSHALNFAWLVRLRWAAITGQMATILIVERVMEIHLPVLRLCGVIAVELLVNIAFWIRRSRDVGEGAVAGALAFDVVVLSALLYLSGGPFNPFSFLYLVHIALGAVVLRPRWTWALVLLALVASGVLFLDHLPLVIAGRDHMRVHLQGMWVAFGAAAAFIVWFLMRVTRTLAAREAELAAARAQKEKITSLATLAGGAAHELSSPLATIAVVARELELQLADAPAGVREDIGLIRSQLDRCREILERMAAQAGDRAGEAPELCSVESLVAEATASLAATPAVRVAAAGAGALRVYAPRRALAQALRGLLKNAQDAGGDEVTLHAAAEADRVKIEIRDAGSGMDAGVLARAGEPFFTTKPPGRGMGLGLFLTRTIVEQLGGDLALRSAAGRGTTATVTLPAARP